MADTFPYEIKRLIYGYSNFNSLKTLRLVSKSWATVGADFLLLPSFNFKSSADIHRLFAIGSVSSHATKVVRCLVFPSHGWDPRYFRNIVCNRHELRQGYEVLNFVPTQAEQSALDELDALIGQKDIDALEERDLRSLISALKLIPRVESIKILCQNPFTHRILRKSWEEYDLEAFQMAHAQYSQLMNILSAVRSAGHQIYHLTHMRLLSGLFETTTQEFTDFLDAVKEVTSFNLVISDLASNFTSETGLAISRLRSLVYNVSYLQFLSITFEVLGSVPLTFLYPANPPDTSAPSPTSTLHTLSLSGISISLVPFLGLLSRHQKTLKRLRLCNIELEGSPRREFLEEIRDGFGGSLEKFQLYGVVKMLANGDDCWMLFPIYDDDWVKVEKMARNVKTKKLEDFVLRGGYYPMVESDGFSIS